MTRRIITVLNGTQFPRPSTLGKVVVVACKLGPCSWLCVLVSAQRYQEKHAVITTNDDDNVCYHKPIAIFD